MGRDFESEFDNIIKQNDFTNVEPEESEEQAIAIDEAAHVLEIINETAMVIASIISEALETGTPFAIPAAALGSLRALHALGEQFITEVTTECDCEDCKADREEDGD